MQELHGQTLIIPKARIVALVLFVAVLAASLFSHATYAEESSDPIKQIGASVESPSGVTATSPTNDRTIVWTWSAPAGGLTPGSENPELDEEGSPLAQQSTDIVSFGYDLYKDGNSLTSGVVDASVLTVTTAVAENGDYTLYVWSITRADDTSAKASGAMTVFIPIPNLPPIKEEDIPVPLDTAPLAPVPLVDSVGSAPTAPQANVTNTPGYLTNNSSASVLSAKSAIPTNVDQAAVASVAKTSSQGWVVLGLPWYFWLVLLVASYIIVRVLYRITVHL